MAMTAGAVVVASNGNVTKSGLAEALYDSRLAAALAVIATYGGVAPTGEALIRMKKGIGTAAQADAEALVAYLVAHQQVQITPSDTGLQRTPNPNNAATNTEGPSATKYLGVI